MRFLSVFVLLAALAPASAQDAAKEEVAGPRILVQPASFDFGKAVQNRTLNKEFSIRNFGTADLVIENVSTTCGCTVAEGYATQIKPGGTTPLRVSLETRTYSGKVQRTVLIRSNDPVASTLEVKVSVLVVPPEK